MLPPGSPTFGGDLGGDGLGACVVDVGHEDLRAAASELGGDGAADPAAGAGDDGRGALQVERCQVGHGRTVPPVSAARTGAAAAGRAEPLPPNIAPMGRLRYAARLGGEFVAYSVVNRAWWVVPLVLLLAVVALAIVVGQAAAPYTLYTLF